MVYTWFTYELYGLDMVYIGIIWYIYMWFINGLHMNYMVYTWFTCDFYGLYMVYI